MYSAHPQFSEMTEDQLFEDYQDYMKSVAAENPDLGMSANTAGNIGKTRHLNSNTDFSMAGVHSGNTKHVPFAVRKGGVAPGDF